MCGRYAITTAPEAIRQLFAYLEQPNFPPRYNVAPTQAVPIVRMAEGKRQLALVRDGARHIATDWDTALDRFGGPGRCEEGAIYPLQMVPMYGRSQSVQIYLPSRSAQVLAPARYWE